MTHRTTTQLPDSYFAVAHHYVSTRMENAGEAVRVARSEITTSNFGDHSVDTRAFVELRVDDHSGDRMVQRWEVFKDGHLIPMPSVPASSRAEHEAFSERRRTHVHPFNQGE